MNPEPRRIPDALLERYLADALSAEAKARLEATLTLSPPDQERLRELRADSEAFLLRHPPGLLVPLRGNNSHEIRLRRRRK